MTLLTIAQDILKETKSAVVPLTIIGNNAEDAAVQVLAALKKAIVDVSRAEDWEELQKEHTFNSVASTEGYALPSDFDRITDNTFWNTTNNDPVLGPQTPEEWRILKNSTVSGATVNDYFRIRGGETLIFPIPSAVEGYIYEYISNLIVEDSGGTGQTGWEADTDVPVADSYLVQLNATWRLLKMQGKPYAEEQRDYELALAERMANNGGNKTVYHISRAGFERTRIGYPDIVVP
jgi:hypothetical protein